VFGAPPGAATAPRASAAAHAPVVLVAEDEPSLRTMLELILRRGGYQPLLCADGAEAVREIERGARIDGAILDLRMPRVTGDQVLARIRATRELEGIPVIVTSAFNDEVQARAVLDAGATDFLSKPFSVHDLTALLERRLPL
jgi:CheY-like chemotaxis protein